jgi:hypothetical protein
MIIMYQIYVYKRSNKFGFCKTLSRIENNKKVHFILIWPMTQKSQICLYSAGKDFIVEATYTVSWKIQNWLYA